MEIYKPYSCSICGNQFKNKKALTTHNRFHHKENTQSVKKTIKNMLAENIKMKDPCSKCQELQVKMLIKNKCFICGGKFKSKGELILHIESNHHEKNYYGVNLHEKETELLQRNDETKVYNNDSRQSDVRTALKFTCPVYNDELSIKHKMSEILHKEKADLSKPTNINKVTENKLLNEKDETETNCNKSDSSNVGLHVKNIPSQLKSRKRETNAQSPTVLRFTCSICGIQFKEKKQLFSHFEDFHKEKEDSIELPMDSAEVVKSEVSEKIHPQNNCTNCESPEMKTDNKYKCTVCGIQYHTKKEMLMHYEYHRKGEHYKNLAPIVKSSKKCDKSLTKSETSSIDSKDHAEGVYVCQSCKRVYYSPARFVKHCCKPKKEGKQNVWDACKKVLAEKFPQQVTYQSPENLLPKLPISKIFPQLKMKVEDITKVCKTEDTSDDVHLQMNSNFENSESSQESSSGIYGKNSGDSNDLDFQINSKNEVLNSVETKDSDLSCANCDLVFTDIEKYELHCDTHTNDEFCCLKEGKEKLHVCDKCGKCFTELTVFQSHYLTHNNNNSSNNKPEVKPFVCGVCLTCFTNFGDIQSHDCVYSRKESLKASKKEKPLICNICGSHFNDLEIFQLHCETHTEDESHNTKPLDETYVCEACDIQFTDVEEFETHCLNHTNNESDYINSVEEKPYICHICGACFVIFNEFEKHCSIHI
ncbi:hypothetical protein CEXT_568291 [Caerostris extrusa]|uniref:C2H2-type domain-containing protein n=1 Tax=Caerostris extrusa TaxID=172846 RepID=A0AAV4VLQ2_CAEEX|nr:hypothetical protein CEXT_568291 [Caerostris extrusa]